MGKAKYVLGKDEICDYLDVSFRGMVGVYNCTKYSQKLPNELTAFAYCCQYETENNCFIDLAKENNIQINKEKLA